MTQYIPPLKKEAMIHSLKEIREVEILADLGGNQFYAAITGKSAQLFTTFLQAAFMWTIFMGLYLRRNLRASYDILFLTTAYFYRTNEQQ